MSWSGPITVYDYAPANEFTHVAHVEANETREASWTVDYPVGTQIFLFVTVCTSSLICRPVELRAIGQANAGFSETQLEHNVNKKGKTRSWSVSADHPIKKALITYTFRNSISYRHISGKRWFQHPGAIAGFVIGGAATLVLLAAGAYFGFKKYKVWQEGSVRLD